MKRVLAFVARRKFWVINVALAALLAPPAAHVIAPPIRFNQFMIQRAELAYGTANATDLGRTVRSVYSSGLNALLLRPARNAPEFEDPRRMFAWVFSWLPSDAVVYPTEGIYYFCTEVGGHEVWGNVRVADLDQGRVSFAYFKTADKDTRIIRVGAEEGLAVRKHSDLLYDVTFAGRTVRFRLPGGEFAPPRALRLEPDEEFVGRVQDESGIRLFLLYNTGTRSFYYVLNEEDGVTDTLAPIEGDVLAGKRTRFVFVDDREAGRKLLVGVDLQNVRRNNFFDGPGDQVPFRADLRDRLYAAYPNTMLGAGVDAHGVLLERREWVRVAIAPLHRYSSLEDLLGRLRAVRRDLPRGEYWTALTKEWWNNATFRERTVRKLMREGKNVNPADYGVALSREDR